MRIEDLKINEPFEKITVKIVEKPEPQEVNYFNKSTAICNCLVVDGTGEATLLLYDEEIQRVNVNNIVEITSGYCKINHGNLQLSLKNGSIKVIFDELFLGQRQQGMTTFLEDIVSILNSNNQEYRKKACEILGEKRKASVEAISRLLTLSKEDYYTEVALNALIEIAKVDKAVRKRFPEIIDIEDKQLRFDSFILVFDSEDSNIDGSSEFSSFLLDRDERIRKIARAKLLQKETMKETLKIVFDSKNNAAIDETFTELTRFSDEIIRSILYFALNHADDYVSSSAIKQAKKLGLEKMSEKEKEKRMEDLRDAFTSI